ncbi:hypothetical protein F5883DRAFT_61053 [Diaporthe sp. PMI_573]|nr:hypothetical protein F5883DRAFT_61053 [Diaporthaceae sp. PMI_573]
MDGSKVVWPGAPSPFASVAREHACSLQRVTVSWGRRPGETSLAGYGLHEPAAIRTASIVYRTRRTVQTRRTIRFARGSGRMPTHNECAGARRLKSQVAGRRSQGGVGLSRHWTGLLCAIPPQFPSSCSRALVTPPPRTCPAACGLWVPECPQCPCVTSSRQVQPSMGRHDKFYTRPCTIINGGNTGPGGGFAAQGHPFGRTEIVFRSSHGL